MKTEITIVIPSIKVLEESNIINSYLASSVKERVFVQFVYLQNLKQPTGDAPSTIQAFAEHELITVTNTRFFDSAEENIYRIQDIVDLFKPFVFLVGEHDIIVWEALEAALAFREKNNLDVMGWNLLCQEMKEDGTYSSSVPLVAVEDSGSANQIVKRLFAGEALSGKIAYPALIAVFGPLDWTAYIGNQLWSKAALSRMLQYHFSEYIYSHVYKQVLFFTECQTRYGLFMMPVIERLSTDFLKARRGEGGRVSPRNAQGASPVFWVGNLASLHEIQDEVLFAMLANSLCLSLTAQETGEQIHVRGAFFLSLIYWGMEIIRYAAEGKSFYFPEQVKNGSLQDLRYIKLFLARILAHIDIGEMYQVMPVVTKTALHEALSALSTYLETLNPNPSLLVAAFNQLNEVRATLGGVSAVLISHASFEQYLQVNELAV